MAEIQKIRKGVLVEITNTKGKVLLGKMGEIIAESSGVWKSDILNRDSEDVIFSLKVGVEDEL